MRYVALVVLASCGRPPSTVCGAPAAGGTSRNVLIILLDDIGVEQVAAYDGSQTGEPAVPKTPTIDCLCDRGMRFDQAWSTPLCSPSRAALLTGQHSDRNGLGYNVLGDGALSLDATTLGELATGSGVRAGLFGKWHLDGWESPNNVMGPWLQGFDTFVGTLGNLQEVGAPPPKRGSLSQYDGYWLVANGTLQWATRYATSTTIDDTLDFIAEAGGDRWLAVVSLHAAHVPVHAPPADLLSTPVGEDPDDLTLYRAMVEAADHEVGRLLDAMDPKTLGNTQVVLVADNGTSPFGQPLDARGRAKATLYEGGVRVPLVVAGPGVDHGVSNALVHLVDVFPTVADWIGAVATDHDGESLVSQLQQDPPPFRARNLTAWNPDHLRANWAIRDEQYKLIRLPGWDGFFDLTADPEERDNRILSLTPEERTAYISFATALDERAAAY